MHTCSPASISRFTLRSAAESPRITVTFLSKRRGGGTALLHKKVDTPFVAGHLNAGSSQASPETEAVGRKHPGQNKKEVKTTTFSPPGVGGVLHDMPLGGSAGLPCQAGLRPHSRNAFWQFVRRLTTKELVFQRFVAPENVPVNRKNRSALYCKSNAFGETCCSTFRRRVRGGGRDLIQEPKLSFVRRLQSR